MTRILYVEDDTWFRDILKTELEKSFDMEVITAISGNSGIQIIQAKDLDLIVSDVTMSDGNGLDILKYLKNIDSKIPLIFFTNNLEKHTSHDYERYLGQISKNDFEQLFNLISLTLKKNKV